MSTPQDCHTAYLLVMCAAIWQMFAVSNLEVHDLKVPLLGEVLRGHRAVAHGRVGL
ncbi:hypothetical protein JOF50_001504 [Corynebacterium mucifaciens]|uniref:Uncharacterized protein n=1 Tax=Corynebacterium mucifaciens TaxID=57171 RepID=A0ABV2NYN4_9CORY